MVHSVFTEVMNNIRNLQSYYCIEVKCLTLITFHTTVKLYRFHEAIVVNTQCYKLQCFAALLVKVFHLDGLVGFS